MSYVQTGNLLASLICDRVAIDMALKAEGVSENGREQVRELISGRIDCVKETAVTIDDILTENEINVSSEHPEDIRKLKDDLRFLLKDLANPPPKETLGRNTKFFVVPRTPEVDAILSSLQTWSRT